MTSEINRCYRALELEPGASLEQVKQAWRELVKVWHPDRFPNDPKLQRKAQERLKEINGAYELLEQYLASETPPQPRRPTRSPPSETDREENRQQRETKRQRTEWPPPQPPPSNQNEQAKSEPKKSRAGVAWAFIAALVVLAVWVISRSNTGRSTTSSSSTSGRPSSRGGLGFSQPPDNAVVAAPYRRGGSVSTLPPDNERGLSDEEVGLYAEPPLELVASTVSSALDERNGFQKFKFGMTPQDARAVLPPDSFNDRPDENATVFTYRSTPMNRIGDYAVDDLSLSFFDGHLYRIDLYFSAFSNEIFEACKTIYGEPFDDDGWRWNAIGEKLRAKSWRGKKTSAAILSADTHSAWDRLVIYEIQANQKAHEYAAKKAAARPKRL